MWPFKGKREEIRQAPYTDAITAQIIASGNTSLSDPDPNTTAAIEIGVGVLHRAFMLAEIEGANVAPITLGNMIRRMVVSGETVYYRHPSDELVPVAGYQIQGSFVRSSWTYRLELSTPSGSTFAVNTDSDSVVHLRYSFDEMQPWIGIGPLQRATLSAKLQANMENSLSDETSGTVGYLLPIPTAGDDPTVEKFKEDLKKLKGKTAVVETTSGGFGEGRVAAPAQDYVPKRIGPDPPDSMAFLKRDNMYSILAAFGVPIELVTASDGTGQREAWRRCLHGTIQPLGVIVTDELSRVYSRPVTISFDRLMASDIQGRARAFQSMVGGGMDVKEAAAQSGLLADE